MNDAFGMPQTALVLGATSDIARAVMRELAPRRLEHVVLAGRDASRLDAAAKELRALGVAQTDTLVWDATEPGHSAMVRDAAERLGHIDLSLVAVGVLGDQRRSEKDPAATSAVLCTNFTGPAAALVSLSEVMRSQGHGRIVVISSVAGVRVRRSNFVYGASKAGLDAFTQGLADALRPSGVGVTIVRPGWVATRMTEGRPPAPMATTPEEVAADLVKGLEQGAPVVWSPPALRFVFAAFRLLPASFWRLIRD